MPQFANQYETGIAPLNGSGLAPGGWLMTSDKIKLQGFNNLTKHLSFNLYDVCFARTPDERQAYLEYIDEVYNAERWESILTRCTNIIGANVLNIARQDYDPQGASVTMLISEGPVSQPPVVTPGPGVSVAAHLDKSHICVHTYPESHPDNGICTFRADVEVSTCGHITPLQALNYLIDEFEPDVLNLDYRIRGFTRDSDGTKIYVDHPITSITDFIDPKLMECYRTTDVNIQSEALYQTKLMWHQIDLERYLYGGQEHLAEYNEAQQEQIKLQLAREIEEIYSRRNIVI